MTTTPTPIKTPEGDKRLEQLREVHAMIEEGMHKVESTKEKLQEYGIVSSMHVGKQKENPSYFDNQEYTCEYYMSQILGVIKNDAWFAMNTVINLIYIYLERVKEEGSQS